MIAISKPSRGPQQRDADPLPDQIARMCGEFQAGWTKLDRRNRGEPDRAWTPKVIEMRDVAKSPAPERGEPFLT